MKTKLATLCEERLYYYVFLSYNLAILTLWRLKTVAVSYNKLWKLLVDKKMSKANLRKCANIAPNTMTKLCRDEEVSLAVLGRICAVLNVNIGDVMEFCDIFPRGTEKGT